MFSRMKKMEKKCFSLIELLIVIGIMGALAALILPAFSSTESAAKDTACDYNQAGTLRYLTMFRSANGVYPSGFHTGLENATDRMDNLTPAAKHNFASTQSEITALTDAMKDSLKNAGIVHLAYARDVAESIDATAAIGQILAVNTKWTEEVDPITGDIKTDGAALTFRGVDLAEIAAVGKVANYDFAAADKKVAQFRKAGEDAFVIVPFFVAPTIDWETYYDGGPNESKISVALAGKCPWGDDGTARYYIAFFKVYTENTGDKAPAAKLLATSCPDCGILEAEAF